MIYNDAAQRTFTLYSEPEWLLHDIAECRKLLAINDWLEVKGLL